MSTCAFEGNSDMYGLGIRIAFYLQWFGTIAASWLAPTEVRGLRLSIALFVAATFLALIIQSSASGTLRVLDVYVTLLLTYGAYYCYVPVYLWRLVSGCSPFWDPTRWPLVRSTTQYKVANLGLLIAVTCYQIWFWTTGIRNLPAGDSECEQYGFFFIAVPLRSGVFAATNIFFAVTLLLCCTFSVCILTKLAKPPRWLRKKNRKFGRKLRKHKLSENRVRRLQILQSLSNLIVVAMVTAATELTLDWNNVTGVDDLTTAGQTIPIIIAAGLLAHVFYIYFWPQYVDSISPKDGTPTSDSSPRPPNPALSARRPPPLPEDPWNPPDLNFLQPHRPPPLAAPRRQT